MIYIRSFTQRLGRFVDLIEQKKIGTHHINVWVRGLGMHTITFPDESDADPSDRIIELIDGHTALIFTMLMRDHLNLSAGERPSQEQHEALSQLRDQFERVISAAKVRLDQKERGWVYATLQIYEGAANRVVTPDSLEILI